MATLRKRSDRWTAEVRKRDPKTGKTIRHSITRNSKTSAAKAAKAVEVAIEEGTWTPDGTRDEMTLGDLIRKYQEEVTPYKKGAKQEATLLDRFLNTDLAHLPAYTLQKTDIIKYRNARHDAGRAEQTIKNELNTLSAVLEEAREEWGHTELNNPVRGLRKTKRKKKQAKRHAVANRRNRRLMDGEEDAILRAASSPLKECFILAVETALRQGELLASDKSWIVPLEKGWAFRLPASFSKTDIAREIPLSTRAFQAVRELERRAGKKATLFHDFSVARLQYQWSELKKNSVWKTSAGTTCAMRPPRGSSRKDCTSKRFSTLRGMKPSRCCCIIHTSKLTICLGA